MISNDTKIYIHVYASPGFWKSNLSHWHAVHKLGKNASLYIILIFYTHSMFKIQTQTVQLNQNIDIMKDASYI